MPTENAAPAWWRVRLRPAAKEPNRSCSVSESCARTGPASSRRRSWCAPRVIGAAKLAMSLAEDLVACAELREMLWAAEVRRRSPDRLVAPLHRIERCCGRPISWPVWRRGWRSRWRGDIVGIRLLEPRREAGLSFQGISSMSVDRLKTAGCHAPCTLLVINSLRSAAAN